MHKQESVLSPDPDMNQNSRTKIESKMLQTAFAIFILSFCVISILFIFLLKYALSLELSFISILVTAISLGVLLGLHIRPYIVNFFGFFREYTKDTKLTLKTGDDSLSAYLKKTKLKFSSDLLMTLEQYNSAVNEGEKVKLLSELTKIFDTDISLMQEELISDKQKTTYLKIIGAMRYIMEFKNLYTQDDPLIEDIFDCYAGDNGAEGTLGLKARNVKGIFASAKNILERAQSRINNNIKPT